MTSFPFRLITVDIDGTLTREHGWRVMARAFGREPEFDTTNRRFFAHEISEDLHLQHLLDLAVGRSQAEVEAVLAATPLVGGIHQTIRELHECGSRVALLSHNPSYVCAWYQGTFGFDDFEATDGEWVRDGMVVDGGPVRADKREGLRRLEGRWGVVGSEVAHVGDGWADAALFPYVGAGIAFNSSVPEVERLADAAVRDDSLTAIVPVLAALRPRSIVEGERPVAHSSNTSSRV
jgi:phosphoserine phosphatase